MKKINWLDHVANLLVVILGITIAFYMEGWREEASNRKQEHKYLEALKTDLQTDIEALDTLLYYNKSMKKALNNLTMASLGRPYGSDSSLIWHTMSIQYNPPFTPQRTTYESLKASGKLDLIDDFDLRNNIVELYEQFYMGADQFDQVLNNHVRDFVKPFYMHEIRFKGPGALDPSFLEKSEFRNIIFAYQYLFGRKDEFYQDVKRMTEEVKDELTSYLGQK